jgi:hypothetical protein
MPQRTPEPSNDFGALLRDQRLSRLIIFALALRLCVFAFKG